MATFNLALDATTQRHKDENGFLHVAASHISKETVNPYYGSEIPGWEEQGLAPDKIYNGYRAGAELKKGAATFNGLPLLMGHHPESADEPQKEHRVGSLGTDAEFTAPYLDNSLIITDAQAIEAIESGTIIQLSAAYRYDPVFEPGEFGGERYDFIMTNIRGNHVALVEEGRAGSDVVVADGKPTYSRNETMKKKLSDKAKAVFKTLGFAMDEAAPELAAAVETVAAAAEKVEQAAEKVEAAAEGTPAPAEDADDLDALLAGVDPELAAKIRAYIESKAGTAADEDTPAEEEKADEKKAADEETAPEKKDDKTAPAMDAALIERRAVAKARKEMSELNGAARAVRPILGEITDPLAFDSADAIYAKALEARGFKPSQYHRSAWRGMVEVALRQQAGVSLAQDSALFGPSGNLEDEFKGLGNISHY